MIKSTIMAIAKKSNATIKSRALKIKSEAPSDIIRHIIEKDLKKQTKKKSLNKLKIDIKQIGVPNICFSLSDSNDTNEYQYTKQRILKGFDDTETWSLKGTIAQFIIPRLERYDEIVNEFSIRTPQAKKEVQYLLAAMKLIVRDSGSENFTKSEKRKVQKGLELFPKILMTLWW